MSVHVMSLVWSADLHPNEKLVLLALADHAKDDGSRVYPGIAHTAWKCGYTPRNTRRIVARLEAKGLLEAVARLEGGRGRTTVYRIVLDAIPLLPPYRGEMEDNLSAFSENPVKEDKKDRKGGQVVPKEDKKDTKEDSGVRLNINNHQSKQLKEPAPHPLTFDAWMREQTAEKRAEYERRASAAWTAYRQEVGQ